MPGDTVDNQLRELLKDAEEGAPNAKNSLLEHIETEILQTGKGSTLPPISLLIFLVKQLTHPNLLYEDIPTLLNVLAQIEAIRISAESQAQHALSLDASTRRTKQKFSIPTPGSTKFTPVPAPGGLVLQKKTKASLEGLLQGKAVVRLSYISEIVLPLYKLYIHSLWTSHHFIKLLKTMRELFPSLSVKPSGDPSPYADIHWNHQLLHRGLSVDERALVHQVGLETKAFLEDARKWDLERKSVCEKKGLSEEEEEDAYVAEFEARFPRAVEEETVLNAIPDYLNLAQQLTDLLEKIQMGVA